MLKPDEDSKGFEVVEAVVEDGESGLESVGLGGGVGEVRGELGAGGVGVGEEDAIAEDGGVGGGWWGLGSGQ